MDRLTECDKTGAYIPLQSGVVKWTLVGSYPIRRLYGDAAERLAAYEDTGLTPEDVALYVACQGRQVSRRELALAAERDKLADEVARGPEVER